VVFFWLPGIWSRGLHLDWKTICSFTPDSTFFASFNRRIRVLYFRADKAGTKYFMKLAPTPILLLFIAFLAGISPVEAQLPSDPVVKKGVADLRNRQDFNEPLNLGGEWGFYWNRLLTPDSLEKAPFFAPFPSLWKDIRMDGKPLPSEGFATYTLTVILPKHRPRLGMDIPDTYCSYALYVNGVLQAENGRPGKTAGSSQPFWASRTIALPLSLPDTLQLLFQVANFWHAKGGTYKEIAIGDKDQLFLNKNRNAAYDLILAGCLFMGALFFMGLYVFGRQDKTTLYFSLFCLLYSYRMIGTDAYVLHTLFTHLNWFITIRIEYLTLSLSVALFGGYTRGLYPQDINIKIMRFMVGFCGLYSLLILFTPPYVFTRFINIFLGAMFLFIAYAFFVYLKAARNRRSGSLYALLSTGVMLLIFLIINLNYFEWLPTEKGLVFAGYIAFFFLQSLALSHRFAHTFRKANLQAHQGLKAKSEFLSTMSHEIRTPLNAVIGMTHLLLHNDPRKDQEKELDVLLFSANNLLSIVNNILDYNKIEEGKIHFEQISMDLDLIASNIVAGLRTAASEKGIGLQLKVDERLERKVMGDPTRTAQVITNLVHNAIKFTNQGTVCISIQVQSLDHGTAKLTLSVEDTGIGIPVDKQELIFERFTQADSSTSRSYGGTGLGLAICKKILELQGVRLQLKSEPGRGSRFYFTQNFLLSPDPVNGQERAIPPSDRKIKKLLGVSILLVEDNPMNVLVAQTILEKEGALVDLATDGEETLNAFESGRHDLILMDLHMPVMDGYQATQLLRKRGETLPIIALTANTPQEVEKDAYSAGLTDIVVKPFDPDNLCQVILRYVQIDPNARRAS
jgi:signal transduction histidine kinase/CheY-like chemotaxis protein